MLGSPAQDPKRGSRSTPQRLMSSRRSLSLNSALVSVGLLLTALLGAGQALVVLFIVGPSQSTDAFLIAYAVYSPFALLGATMRRTLVPLLGTIDSEDRF